MRLLLDTHAFLWAAGAPEQLSCEAQTAIADRKNDVLVSAATAWEIALKTSLGKLEVPGDPETWFPARIRSFGFETLPVLPEHALAIARLPDHHKDPFDRLLIVQAQIEGLHIVTRDPKIQRYAVNVLPA